MYLWIARRRLADDDDIRDRVCFPAVRHGGLRPERVGQIVDGTSFAAALTALARSREVRRVLELGTWYGGGSTQSLARGLMSAAPADNCVAKGNERCCRDLVVTVEVFEPAWLHARRYLHDLPVWCVRGSTVTPDEMLSLDEVPPSERGTHFDLYYQRDLALMRKSKPQLRRLCAKVAFDLVLIDGNEYTGWGEFERVRDECRPRYIALHDTGTLKTAKVEAYLEAHTDEYRLLLRKGETDASPACDLVGCLPEGLFAPNEAGWAIYQRSDY